MKYYAYIPREDGSEPMGSGLGENTLFECKGGLRYAIPMAKRRLRNRDNFVLISYTNFYDDKTFKILKGEHKQ